MIIDENFRDFLGKKIIYLILLLIQNFKTEGNKIMIIRKLFKFEGAHIVRNCSSELCKKSIHGHSYIVEVFLSASGLDNGQMIYDFGLMKGTIKDFIESFDHAYSIWNKEGDEFKNFMMTHSDRWILMPVSPSAEAYSLMFLFVIDKIMNATDCNNGEKGVFVNSVRVHETATGYAEAFRPDLTWVDFRLKDIVFSDAIKKDWKDPDMYGQLQLYSSGVITQQPFVNAEVEQQV